MQNKFVLWIKKVWNAICNFFKKSEKFAIKAEKEIHKAIDVYENFELVNKKEGDNNKDEIQDSK